MSKNETEESTPPPEAPGLLDGLRKPLYALIALVVIMVIFGQVMPRLFPVRHGERLSNSELEAMRHSTEEDAAAPAANDRIEALEAKIKTLEGTIDTLSKAPPNSAANDARLSAMQAKIDALEQQVQHPVSSPADNERNAHVDTVLKQQDEALQALKTQIGDMAVRQKEQLAALAAFGTLKDAVVRGETYSSALSVLGQLAASNSKAQEPLKTLADDSEKGAITLAGLQSLFESSVPKALTNPDSSVLARSLRSLISIRKVGEQKGADDESVLARAEDTLNRGEVDSSLKELEALSPSATAAMAGWTGKAQDFLKVRHALDALQLALVDNAASTPPLAQPDASASP